MKIDTDRGPWICTISGRQFHYMDIEPDSIQPAVIAHSLSNICRYNGHVDEFYSVAQHCWLVSHAVPVGFGMDGLLHDAAEAFVGDMVRPLKDLVGDAFRKWEEAVERAIAERFQVEWPIPKVVKTADVRVFHTEVRDLTTQSYRYPHEESGLTALPEKIYPWPPHVACREWMKRFVELGGL